MAVDDGFEIAGKVLVEPELRFKFVQPGCTTTAGEPTGRAPF